MKMKSLCMLLLLLILSSSFLEVARCGDIGIVGDEEQPPYGGDSFSLASAVETICVFPQNPKKLIVAGEESELLVGVQNDGESSVNVIAIHANVHLPMNHQYLVQNLSFQAFENASVPPSAQATFPYIVAVSKLLQSGTFDLVGIIVYEIDQHPYQSTFYNGTIEVTESGGLFSVETVFLSCSFVAIIGFLVFNIVTGMQQRLKKTKRPLKVEVETATTDSSIDEWLQGTAYTQGSKSKKKK